MEQSVANLVDMRDVSFTRGNRCIFDNISLTVPRGKITAIMGPSGIGKTTLLRLIGGQIAPDHGEILFDGENIPAMSRSRLYTVRKRMSMLFQSGALFTDMNVFDNVAYPLREHTQLPAPLLHSTVMMKLEAVGLRGAAKLMPSELSGGMARRAALARAIALEPDLIMFDDFSLWEALLQGYRNPEGKFRGYASFMVLSGRCTGCPVATKESGWQQRNLWKGAGDHWKQ